MPPAVIDRHKRPDLTELTRLLIVRLAAYEDIAVREQTELEVVEAPFMSGLQLGRQLAFRLAIMELETILSAAAPE